MQTREPRKYESKTASSRMVMSPEILTNCLSNMGRNNNIKTVIDKSRHESRQERNIFNKHWEQNVTFPIKKQQKMMKKLKCMEDHIDSAKSEEEAATMIQATYRGYKVRRKFDEMKKSSLEGKQNAQKVAELLSMTTNQWALKKSLNPAKAFNNITNCTKNTLQYN
ncbi:uncharacterized protein LOC105197109 isoform X2 [Solenopsis invicta]|nr:uncharacterized protein LOC105197109 isoform X2 [Solenopsis invicta]